MGDTSDNNTDHYQGVLLEEINERLKAILEGQDAMVSVPADIAKLKTDMEEVKDDVRVIKSVVTAQSSDLDDHEVRIKRLEKATA